MTLAPYFREFHTAARAGRKAFATAGRRYDLFYDVGHWRKARRAQAQLEVDYGPLSAATRRQCDDYARDVLGSIRYAPWLRTYATGYGRFVEGWMPDNYYGRHVVRLLKGQYGSVGGMRALQGLVFGTDRFPDIGAFVNGSFFDGERRRVDDRDLRDILFAQTDRVVFKRDASGRGKGFNVFTPADFDPARIRALGNGVFQRWIVQHPVLARLSPDAVATLRVLTVIEPSGRVAVLSSMLRLGRVGETHVNSVTEGMIPVDRESGVIGEFGFFDGFHRKSQHPDTGIVFGGVVVPGLQAACTLVAGLHARMPFAQTIGWDLTVDDQGEVRIMEWNGGHNGINYTQTLCGGVFAGQGWETLWRR